MDRRPSMSQETACAHTVTEQSIEHEHKQELAHAIDRAVNCLAKSKIASLVGRLTQSTVSNRNQIALSWSIERSTSYCENTLCSTADRAVNRQASTARILAVGRSTARLIN